MTGIVFNKNNFAKLMICKYFEQHMDHINEHIADGIDPDTMVLSQETMDYMMDLMNKEFNHEDSEELQYHMDNLDDMESKVNYLLNQPKVQDFICEQQSDIKKKLHSENVITNKEFKDSDEYKKFIDEFRKYILDNLHNVFNSLNSSQKEQSMKVLKARINSIKDINLKPIYRHHLPEGITEPDSIEMTIPSWLFFVNQSNRLIPVKVFKNEKGKYNKLPDTYKMKSIYGTTSWTNNALDTSKISNLQDYIHDKNWSTCIMSDYFAVVNGTPLTDDKHSLMTVDIDEYVPDDQIDHIQNILFNEDAMVYQKSISGGCHIFITADSKLKIANSVKSYKISDTPFACDIRSNNGYTVVAGPGYDNIKILVPYDTFKKTLWNVISDKMLLNLQQDINCSSINLTRSDIVNIYPSNAFYQYLHSDEFSRLLNTSSANLKRIRQVNTKVVGSYQDTKVNVHSKMKTTQLHDMTYVTEHKVKSTEVFANEKDILTKQLPEGTKFGPNYTEGCRNNVIFSLASWMHLNKWTIDDAFEYLKKLNDNSYEPLDDDEIARTVHHAFSESKMYGLSSEGFELIKNVLTDKDDKPLTLFRSYHSYQFRTHKKRKERTTSHFDESINDILNLFDANNHYHDIEDKECGIDHLVDEKGITTATRIADSYNFIVKKYNRKQKPISGKEVSYLFREIIIPISQLSLSDHIHVLRNIIKRKDPSMVSEDELSSIETFKGQYHQFIIKNALNKHTHLKAMSPTAKKLMSSKLFNYLTIYNYIRMTQINVRAIKGHGLMINSLSLPHAVDKAAARNFGFDAIWGDPRALVMVTPITLNLFQAKHLAGRVPTKNHICRAHSGRVSKAKVLSGKFTGMDDRQVNNCVA